MAQFFYPNNPPTRMPQTQLRAPPFYFVDDATYTRVRLEINEINDFPYLIGLLREASAPVATRIKNTTYTYDGKATTAERPVQYFGRKDGIYLFRVVTVRPKSGGQPLVTTTQWSTLQATSLPGLFNGPHMRQIGSFIEIQHSLQHFENIVNGAPFGGLVFPLTHRPIQQASPLPTPQSAPLVPPFPPAPPPPPRPASAPASLVGPAPIVEPMRCESRSPAPIEAIGTPVVCLPPVMTPMLTAPMPIAVTPVTATYARGVVDSGALSWYRRGEELRRWLRFGEADAVESEDVWTG